MKRFLTIAMIVMLLMTPTMVTAECKIQGTGEVNVISNSFPSLEVIATAMKKCNREGLKIDHKLTRGSSNTGHAQVLKPPCRNLNAQTAWQVAGT